MGHELKRASTRRYVRAHGPFDAFHLGAHGTIVPVLVYDLNLGGGFVNCGGEQPTAAALDLTIALPQDGLVTVHAEMVYRQESGMAVRFVDVDPDTIARLARAVDALQTPPIGN